MDISTYVQYRLLALSTWTQRIHLNTRWASERHHSRLGNGLRRLVHWLSPRSWITLRRRSRSETTSSTTKRGAQRVVRPKRSSTTEQPIQVSNGPCMPVWCYGHRLMQWDGTCMVLLSRLLSLLTFTHLPLSHFSLPKGFRVLFHRFPLPRLP